MSSLLFLVWCYVLLIGHIFLGRKLGLADAWQWWNSDVCKSQRIKIPPDAYCFPKTLRAPPSTDDCRSRLIKYPKGAPCYAPILTGSEHRAPSPCAVDCRNPTPKRCFDMERVIIQPGRDGHRKMISSFLFSNYWHRDPSITSVYMGPQSRYLNFLNDKYCVTGDRFLALEKEDDLPKEQRLIGVLQAEKVYPRTAGELELWAAHTVDYTDRCRKFLEAYMLRGPDLFKKYNVPYIYLVQLLVTATEVQRQGVAKLLLRHAIAHASEIKHPLVMVPAKSHFLNKVCLDCKMKREWSMDYKDYADERGFKVFYPRRPHTTIAIYSKLTEPGDHIAPRPPPTD